MVRNTETNTASPSSQVQFHSSILSSSTSLPRSFTRGWGIAPSCHSLFLRLFPSSSCSFQGLQLLSGACSSALQGNICQAMVSLGSQLQGNLWGMSSPPLTLALPLLFLPFFISFSALWSSVVFFTVLKYVFHEVPPPWLQGSAAHCTWLVGAVWNHLYKAWVSPGCSSPSAASTKAQIHRNICFCQSHLI